VARDAVVARVTGGEGPPIEANGELAQLSGAFVTLTSGGQLRGCIGNIEPDRPLVEVIRHCAAAAATQDPRFPPVAPEEIPKIHIELSVLFPAQLVEHIEDIQVGRDGLIVEWGARRGLLLPQVAEEWGWDREAFLRHTCLKAGLPHDAWRRGARVLRFEAEVFGEPGAPAAPTGSSRPRD
jgi:AmmeMemoRadiSam system protein A